MCATVNSLSTSTSLSGLRFDKSQDVDEPKRVLLYGFLYAYFCNASILYTLLSASFKKHDKNIDDYVNFGILKGGPHTEMRRYKTHNTERGYMAKLCLK